MVKNPSAQSRRHAFHPWVRKIPWRREWQPTPVFLPWEIPWTKELGGLKSKGLQKSWSQLSDWTTSPSYKDLHSFWLFSTFSPSRPLKSICLVFNWLHQLYFYFYFVKYINVDIFPCTSKSLFTYFIFVLNPSLCLTLCSPMDIVCQAPLSVGLSSQEYWSGLSFISPRSLPDSEIKPSSLVLTHVHAKSHQSFQTLCNPKSSMKFLE